MDSQESRAVWPPTPGFFKIRLVRRGWRVPAMIVRSEHGWQAVIDGVTYETHDDPAQSPEIGKVWGYGTMISAADYDWLVAVRENARVNDRAHPSLSPLKPINYLTLTPLLPARKPA